MAEKRSPVMSEFKVTAQVQPYVDALGLDLAVEFILQFGGSYTYVSESPQERSEVVMLVGRENTIRLAKRVGAGSLRVHNAKPWLAAYFRYKKGWTVNATARKLHVSDVAIRRWLGPKQTQLELFPE